MEFEKRSAEALSHRAQISRSALEMDKLQLEMNGLRIGQLAQIKDLLSGTQVVQGKAGAQIMPKPRDLTVAERTALDNLLRNIAGDALEVEERIEEGGLDLTPVIQPLPDESLPSNAPALPSGTGSLPSGGTKPSTPTADKGRTPLAPVPIPSTPVEADTTGKVPVVRTGNADTETGAPNKRAATRGATRVANVKRLTGDFSRLEQLVSTWNGDKRHGKSDSEE